ncbi:MAG: tetratricopeptide repeat protein [Desulfuromonadales bacterium]|nr:tetratricopeptide repeat protein [Desulfuromonadales bacterium]
MSKETILVGIVALVAGLVVGLLIGQKTSTAPTARPAGSPAPAQVPTVNLQQKLNELKSIVAREPENRQAWITLGNEYFDSNQFMNAIEAYDKALAIDPNDANVLTDQGVMFRRLGWFDRAITNFNRANEADPTHATSIFNLGIVYRYDVQDFAKAKEAWMRFLEVNPNGPGSDRVRQELEFLQTHPDVPSLQ